tara:strand:+ start:228 stop:428 length:201 start_codon:yes stop_codon:yes gene_type:complete
MSNEKNELIKKLKKNLIQSENQLNDFINELTSQAFEKDDLESLKNLIEEAKIKLEKIILQNSNEEE